MQVAEVLNWLQELAPISWAEDWDRVGLQIGSLQAELSAVVLTVDVTPEALALAREKGAGLIITHHPVLFTPITQIHTDTAPGRLLAELLRSDLAVYAAHTNLDRAPQVGPAAALAASLGLQEVRPLIPRAEAGGKLVTFLPPSEVPAVRQALSEAGAGIIGAYRECAFHSLGEGHFRAPADAQPAAGEAGIANSVVEARLEMVFPPAREAAVVRALLAAHPYEEPAFEVYHLAPRPTAAGFGRIGRLPEPLTVAMLADRVAQALDLETVQMAGEGRVEQVALLPGAGGSAVGPARAAGAQVLVTGEIGYHEAAEALSEGLALIAAGHPESEALLLPALAAAMREEFGAALRVAVSTPRPTWRVMSAEA